MLSMKRMTFGKTWVVIGVVFMCISSGSYTNVAVAEEVYCGEVSVGPITDGGGPWDYTNPEYRDPHTGRRKGNLQLVEGAHFTKKVERLERGETAPNPMGDIDYTLYRFPNHHRALWALSRLQRRNGGSLPTVKGTRIHERYVECYFERALLFKSDDPVVHMLYGMHLHLTGKMEHAEKQYKESEKLNPESAELLYNMGLFYFDKKKYNLAKEYARKAYNKGYPLSGLKDKLKRKGLW